MSILYKIITVLCLLLLTSCDQKSGRKKEQFPRVAGSFSKRADGGIIYKGNTYTYKNDLEKVSNVPNIVELKLSWSLRLPKDDFDIFTKFERLEYLALPRQTTDLGLQHVAKIRGITNFKVFNSRKITDAGLMYIANFKKLEQLHLYGCTKITDSGLEVLKNFEHLQEFYISDTKLTGEGLQYLTKKISKLWCLVEGIKTLKHIEGMDNLTSLDIYIEEVTDDELRFLAGLKNITSLSIQRGNKITNSGLQHLTSLTKLRSLDLCFCEIDAIDNFQKMTYLEKLDMGNTNVTDDSLKNIGKWTSLVELGLRMTKLTDESVEHLSKLSALKMLNVQMTKISKQGVEELKKAIPECKIVR